MRSSQPASSAALHANPKSRPGRTCCFFDCREDAISAGFRPCKRCRPDLTDYQPLDDAAKQVRSIVERHYAQKQRLTDEIKKLGLSKRRIDQIFKAYYGVSLNDYANNLRIHSAAQQLRQSTLPVIEIAYSLGFESLSAFFAFFRKNTGMTPSEYRKQKGKLPFDANACYAVYKTLFGQITIACTDSAIVALQFGSKIPDGAKAQRTALADKAAIALDAYFSGRRMEFDIPIASKGTPFQARVWDALRRIPYGETRTYKQIATAIGNPAASRAVGMAANKNAIAVLVPCHRVIGANGSLVGYAAGLAIKEKLLKLERGVIDHHEKFFDT
jgi:AraC family transcriptional regulator of adaptative response/methylated-DNA-[protein]-cysteine methyltransferase